MSFLSMLLTSVCPVHFGVRVYRIKQTAVKKFGPDVSKKGDIIDKFESKKDPHEGIGRITNGLRPVSF